MTEGHGVGARPVLDGRRIKWTLEQQFQATQQRVRIDWLRFTVPLDAVLTAEVLEDLSPDRLDAMGWKARSVVREARAVALESPGATLAAALGARKVADMLGCFEVGTVEDRGQDYYTVRCPLLYEGAIVGYVLAGGKSSAQASTVHVNLFGSACLWLSHAQYAPVRQWVEQSRGWITRVDLAVDVFEGEDITELPGLYMQGAFDVRGKRPTDTMHGSWASGHSRTFQVGQRQTGKCMRAYEKGDELLGPEACDPLVRYEVELRNSSRVIDLAVLDRPADFFAGAYDFCAQLLQRLEVASEPQRIPTIRATQDKTALGAALRGAKWFARTCAPMALAIFEGGGDLFERLMLDAAGRVPARLTGFARESLRNAFEQVAAGLAPPVAPIATGA